VRSRAFIGVAVALLLLVAGAVGVYAYDSSREDTIASGVSVAGVAIGGLDRAEAEARLREQLARPLTEPVVVRSRGRRFTLTGKVARMRVDVKAMVDQALARSRDGNVLTRTVRGLTGGEVDADIEPEVEYSERAVRRLVARVARKIDRPPRDARVRFSGDGVEPVSGRSGLKVDRADLAERVRGALVSPDPGDRLVTAKVATTKPEVTTAELRKRYPTVITINRAAYRLRLFKNLRLEAEYPIAVGQVGLETPAGLYDIQNKAIDPAWHVPHSAWAGDLAGQVIPGGVPENPLKARWMGIYDGAGIHGTDARGSIGTNASHGCIRMLVEDVIELYDQVEVGAPVYIA
jgi:lipoprotein-anchoring transpeptidase ErfK/SrfK